MATHFAWPFFAEQVLLSKHLLPNVYPETGFKKELV
jgi:hypothetical protein